MILHPSFSPKPTMLSLDLGEISSMTCRISKHQHVKGTRNKVTGDRAPERHIETL